MFGFFLNGRRCYSSSMARAAKSKKKSKAGKKGSSRSRGKSAEARTNLFGRWRRRALRFVFRAVLAAVAIVLLLVVVFSIINPPTTHTIWSEKRRLGEIDRLWVPLEQMSPVMARSVVAAEDANFCLHWGFDVAAIRAAIEDGGTRGGSTITQQVTKNVFLWQGRSWVRKALETLLTPVVEAVWSKRRIIEVYLNVAETGEGIFGTEAAARHYFDVGPDELTARQAALIASVLPNPKGRSASKPTAYLRKRAAAIADGAATIGADGRAACF